MNEHDIVFRVSKMRAVTISYIANHEGNMYHEYMQKKLFIVFIALAIGFVGLMKVRNIVLAEQSGSSPESGATSRIKTVYDSLVALTHGSESAGGWGNWGAYWNRIRSAGEWVPTGDADEADVASGKTFYKNSRTQKTGTASLAPNWSNQSLQDYDDCRGNMDCSSTSDEDTTTEEATWTNTAGSATTGVWKDTRTGLYWSVDQESKTNEFTRATCDFFTTTPRGAYAGADSDCGNAINTCATLSLEAVTGGGAKTDWYLPSQKELQQAYIDGIYNTNSTFATASAFWSSTERSDYSGLAWYETLYDGRTNVYGKGNGNSVRCVRRD